MKSLLKFLIVPIITLSFHCHGQTIPTNGVAKIIEFTNESAKFIVPPGKTWHVINIFCDFITNYVPDPNGGEGEHSDVNIFLKSINGTVITDFSINKIGTRLYGTNRNWIHPLPLVLPENTIFDLVIISGTFDKPVLDHGLIGFINFIEY